MDISHRSSSTSASDRLNAFRQPMDKPSTGPRTILRRNEVLMGTAVILVCLLVVALVAFRPAKNQTVIESSTEAGVVTQDPGLELLAGEALIALAVQPGHFPPQLNIGDSVRIAVTPGLDGAGDTRLLPDEVVVSDISSSSDSQIESVITVRAPQSILVNVAESGEIHIAKVNGASK